MLLILATYLASNTRFKLPSDEAKERVRDLLNQWIKLVGHDTTILVNSTDSDCALIIKDGKFDTEFLHTHQAQKGYRKQQMSVLLVIYYLHW